MELPRAAIAALALVGAVGLAVWIARSEDAPDAQPTSGNGLAAELEALREALRDEREERRALADEVGELRAQLAALSADAVPPVATAPAPRPPDPPREPRPERATDATPPGANAWFDADALDQQGVPPAEVARIRELYEENQLELLYLRDRAAREGWLQRPRYREEVRELQGALRAELDEADYDRLLYATGRPNRVVIQGILADSPAERSGLKNGDLVLRYAESAVFQPNDLVQATRGGQAGASVAVDLLRDGDRVRVYLPRGPLGARLKSVRRPPEPGW